MKLGTLKNGTRDGTPVVVSRDLQRAVHLSHLHPTLQGLLDDWERVEAELQHLSDVLNAGQCKVAFPVKPTDFMAPIPRAYGFVDASAFLHHGQLMTRAFGLQVTVPEGDSILYQGASDRFQGACDPHMVPAGDLQVDFEGEVGVVLSDTPMGVTVQEAKQCIRLLVLFNDMSYRRFLQQELLSGFGPIHAKPTTTFAPVAVTPDELGTHWKDGRVHLPLTVHLNGHLFGQPHGGEMDFSFPELISQLARTRSLAAGTVLGSGTFSNRDPSRGSACISERRALEMIQTGSPRTPFMNVGDRVRMEVFLPDKSTVFGAIHQQVVAHTTPVLTGQE
ncbi:fumarylacetoacetate hydrolase family protein [Deinococcus roseus]|uniref:Fumarylacetoacetate (FAA) hydrolase n=1 Tax=Deinococcus roseus TaxID=392414 RepID=A0ABQ2DHL6_9DEIO|nr:fumarylacetoacetate hydrolase family protein [Deinococcus roseus]GGJ58459.1 fumarylacetoacetate (FAA) hydrolase [Deinococcus roseus]